MGAHAVAWLMNKFKSALPGNLLRPLEPAESVPELLEPADCIPEDLPVHRAEVIEQLGAELPAASDALRYRDNFVQLLPQRIEELSAEIRCGNQPAAVTSLLSLSVGSRMVGAPRLEHVLGRCLADLRSGRNAECLPALIRESERFLAHVADTCSAEPPRGTGRHRLGP